MKVLLALLFALTPASVDDRDWPPKTQREAGELIHASPKPLLKPNPLALIRAVNGLHTLGYARASAALNTYLAVPLIDPTNPDATFREGYTEQVKPYDERTTLDGDRAWLVAALLFDTDPESRFYRDQHPCSSPSCSDAVYRSEVRVEDGIPFFIGWDEDVDGPFSVRYGPGHADRDNVRLRATPLHPSDNPFAAADKLFEKFSAPENLAHYLSKHCILPKTASRGEFLKEVQARIRGQAVMLVTTTYREPTETDWRALREWASLGNLKWNPERQAYDVLKPCPIEFSK